MARTRGAKNKRTLLREEQLRQAALQAATGLDRSPKDADCLAVIEEAMRYFYAKAWNERWKTDGNSDDKVMGASYLQAASLAEKVAPYSHARLSAMKLAGGSNNPVPRIRDDITADELRAEIMAEMQRLGLFERAPEPQGIENRSAGD
jgi:hypothetical protein